MDNLFQEVHREIFAKTDCLNCGNCCRTLGPRITQKDIERTSVHLKIREKEFTNKYLKIDEDGDYIFKSMPCPFLGNDNYCSIYEARPKACREFPHTDRKKITQLFPLTLKNTETCPAVYDILEQLKNVTL